MGLDVTTAIYYGMSMTWKDFERFQNKTIEEIVSQPEHKFDPNTGV